MASRILKFRQTGRSHATATSRCAASLRCSKDAISNRTSRIEKRPGPSPGLFVSQSLKLQLLLPLPKRAQTQGVEPDEAGRVAVVVGDRAFLEGDKVLIVERILALAPDHGDRALVEPQAHAAGHEFLALVDRDLQHLALWRKPEAVVDELGVFGHQLVLEMHRAAVERDALDTAMRGQQDRSAR